MRREHDKISQTGPDEHTLLLLTGDDFVDHSIYQHTINNSGVTLSTESKYGVSYRFNGSAMLNVDIGDKRITDGVFTLEMWLKLDNTLKQYKCVADFCGHDNFYFDAADSRDGTLILIFTAPNWFPSNGWAHDGSVWLTTSWQHVAIVGDGTHNYIYHNGLRKTGTYYDAFARQLTMKNGKIRIGNIEYQNLSRYFKGYMEEIRLSNIVRYTDNFTPQSLR